MDANATTAVTAAAANAATEWFASLFTANAPAATALVATFASFGLASLCVCFPYCLRLCRGQDIITECMVGKSVVTISIDATGNGLHAAKKLVVDMNTRKVHVDETGQSDSPPVGVSPLHIAAAGSQKPS